VSILFHMLLQHSPGCQGIRNLAGLEEKEEEEFFKHYKERPRRVTSCSCSPFPSPSPPRFPSRRLLGAKTNASVDALLQVPQKSHTRSTAALQKSPI